MTRRILRLSILSVLLLAFSAGAAAAEKAPVTCQQTTESASQPFIKSLGAAEAGLQYHAEQTALKVARLEKYIADLLAAKEKFDERRKTDLAGFDKRIEAMEKAIRDAQKANAEARKKNSDALNKARKAKNEAEIKRLSKAIADLRAKSAAGKNHSYSGTLGYGQTVANWRLSISKEKAKRAASAAAHSAGEVPVYFGLLGYSLTWQAVLELVATQRELLAKVRARQESFYLPSLGYGMTGPKIDQLVAERQKALDDARARMAAGTFQIYVPTLGYGTDRNKVLELIGQARASLEKVRSDWPAKEYRIYNPRVGAGVTNGWIEEQISKINTAIAELMGLGDEANLHVPKYGSSLTGSEAKRKAAAAKTPKDAAKWREMYGHWSKARAAWVENKKATIAKHEAQLAKHRELWLEDIRKREADLSGRLARALAQTPCGGGSADAALVDRHTRVLDAASESDIERNCRRGIYGDNVYVTTNGERHGSPRNGLQEALADTGLGDPATIKDPTTIAVDALVLDSKNFVDWLVAWKDAGEFGVDRAALDRAQLAINRLQGEMNALTRLSKTKGKAFKQARNKILKRVTSAIDDVVAANGYFFSSDFDKVLKSVEDSAALRRGLDRNSRTAIQNLNRMRNAATSLNSWHLPRFANMANDLSRVTAANLDAAQAMVNTVRQGELGTALKGMSNFERGLIVLSVAAAAAEASDLIKQGKAASDAVARASINLTVELAIGGIPLTAAAQVVSLVVFETAARISGDDSLKEVNVEAAAKALAQAAADEVAFVSGKFGESFAESESESLDNSASESRIRDAITKAERRLDKAVPGSAESKHLMKSRARLRALQRAKQRAEDIARLEKSLAAAERELAGLHSGSTNAKEIFARIDALKSELARRKALNC